MPELTNPAVIVYAEAHPTAQLSDRRGVCWLTTIRDGVTLIRRVNG